MITAKEATTIRGKIKALRQVIEDGDYEAKSMIWSAIVTQKLKELDPDFIRRLDKITKDTPWW